MLIGKLKDWTILLRPSDIRTFQLYAQQETNSENLVRLNFSERNLILYITRISSTGLRRKKKWENIKEGKKERRKRKMEWKIGKRKEGRKREEGKKTRKKKEKQ